MKIGKKSLLVKDVFVCVFFEQSDFILFQLLKTEKCAIFIKYVFKVNKKDLTLWYFYRKCQGKKDRQCSPPSGTSYCLWVPGVLCRPHSWAVIAIVRCTTFSLILILELFSCCSFFVELENEEGDERCMPVNCDNSLAMGSAEDTRDSRTVTSTGWCYKLAVRLALSSKHYVTNKTWFNFVIFLQEVPGQDGPPMFTIIRYKLLFVSP